MDAEEAEEEDPAEEDMEDLASWCSVDSSDGEVRAPRASGAKKKATKKKNVLSKEEKDELRKWNNPIVGMCRRVVRQLEPLVKECRRATKSQYGSEALKDEAAAAGKLLKEANGIIKKSGDANTEGIKLPEFSIDMDGLKDLCKSLKSKCTSISQVDVVLQGMDDQSLVKLKEVVTKRAEAKDVE